MTLPEYDDPRDYADPEDPADDPRPDWQDDQQAEADLGAYDDVIYTDRERFLHAHHRVWAGA